MKKKSWFFLVFVFFVTTLASGQTYVGSGECSLCHMSQYNYWEDSGHHYKLQAVTSGQAPTYPFEAIPGTPNVVNPPTTSAYQYTWGDVTYVIGGYYWKARFMDSNGYIITGAVGDLTQWNVHTQVWAAYSAGQTKPYDCGSCHTTGFSSQGSQGGLVGIIGTWEEEGVGCEACHGPGSEHAMTPSSANITIDPTSELCGQCHFRDSQHRIKAANGWIEHHEQYDEFLHSPHYESLTCNTCHNVHKSTVYDQGGLKVNPSCASCHSGYNIVGMDDLECWDCHMPYSSKSAVAYSSNQADVTSHQFRIWVTTFPKDSMFYTEGSSQFVKTDSSGQVYGNTLDLVCLRCHNEMTLQEAYWIADDIHTEGLEVEASPAAIAENFNLKQNYPNPFNPATTITFALEKAAPVNLSVYDLSGRLVSELYSGDMEAGEHSFNFDGGKLASGVYIYKLTAGDNQQARKMLLVK